MKLRRLFALLLALAMVAAACGGDDAATDEPAETTAAAEEPAETTAPAEEPMDEEEPVETTAAAEEPMDEEEPMEFEPVTMLVVNNMAHLPSFVASELGLWADRGLDVNLELLGSGADIAAGLSAGQAEFGAVNGGTGVAPQRAGGLLTKLIAPYNSDATNAKYVDWISMIGRVDSGIDGTPESLMGKKIGVTGGGTPRAFFTEYLKRNNMTEDDLEIVALSVPDMPAAISTGEVDVVIPWDPFRESALRELGDNGIEFASEADLVLSTIGLGAVDGQLEEKPDEFKAFVEGLVEATFIIRSNPEAAAPVVLSFIEGITEEDAIKSMARNSYDPRFSVCLEVGVEETAAGLVEAGRFESLPEGPDGPNRPFTAADLLDSRVMEEVLAEHPEWIADLPPLPTSVDECDGLE